MRRVAGVALACGLSACAGGRSAESSEGWYTAGDDYGVSEALLFTDEPYSLPANCEADAEPNACIVGLPKPAPFETLFADTMPAAACADWSSTSQLPMTVTGIATAHPRYYFKTTGCRPEGDRDIDSDEKYYGSFFLEDATGGMFVLGDSKVAHFEMGDRVTLEVRAMKESFGLTMVYSQDLVEVERGPFPIAYQEPEGPLGESDAYQVRRMTGTVGYTGDFGEVQLCTGAVEDGDFDDLNADDPRANGARIRCVDEGDGFFMIIDSELQRRGVELSVGERVEVTGPVLFSFDEYRIVVTRLGQLQYLD